MNCDVAVNRSLRSVPGKGFAALCRGGFRAKLATSLRASGPNLVRTLITLLEPSLAAVREPAERTRAMSRSLRVLNALQVACPPAAIRCRSSPTSACPQKRRSTRTTASRLHVKKLPEGWMVYSVGRNLVDDGGNLDGKTDIGVGPMSQTSSQEKRG